MPPGLGGLVVLVFEEERLLNCFTYLVHFLIICRQPDETGEREGSEERAEL